MILIFFRNAKKEVSFVFIINQDQDVTMQSIKKRVEFAWRDVYEVLCASLRASGISGGGSFCLFLRVATIE